MTRLINKEQVVSLIKSGKKLLISADSNLLKDLPVGNWVGGSIPYFLTQEGGVFSKDKYLVQHMPSEVEDFKIIAYTTDTMSRIPKDTFRNGFSFILIPSGTKVHEKYSKECFFWDKYFERPVLGWITGYDLNTLDKDMPIVMNGFSGEVYTDCALVFHARLRDNVHAKVDIINIFNQGPGVGIKFETDGFEASVCTINGNQVNLVDFIEKNKIDTKLPLVASYMGTNVNVSFKEIDKKNKVVKFYAPIFTEIEYKVASPVGDYEKVFLNQLKKISKTPFFTCNCILNYLYANMEGRKVGDYAGPITFGEIAYVLLNQTFVYITIERINERAS